MERVPASRKRVGIGIVIVVAAAVLAGVGSLVGWQVLARSGNPKLRIETSLGTITAKLRADKAPETVANFMHYVDAGSYDGTIFHRVMRGFMIQGGSYTATYAEPETRPAIRNESRADMPNRRGTLAMARTSDPHSATAGFYINLVDNDGLNCDPARREFGYCVFGAVTDGLDVVDQIGSVRTGPGGPFGADVPVEPVIIKSIRRVH